MASRPVSLIFTGFFPYFALVALTLTTSRSARAEPVLIWYRAGQGCPEGPTFLERLERRAVQARLARVGDRIDFVVTLGRTETKSSGQLERQTKQGTVAIRQVEDAECDAVADILALTLALTIEPQASVPPAGTAADPPTPKPAVAAAPAIAKSGEKPTPAAPPPASEGRAPQPPPASAPERRSGELFFGVEASAWNLFGSSWLLGAGAVAEGRAGSRFALPTASVRGVLRGGAEVDPDAAASRWLAALRLEGCPAALALGVLELRPCAAVDLGAIGASAAGDGDVAFWSALAGHGRVGVAVSRSLRLEGQAGVLVPLTRYEVVAGAPPEVLEKTKVVGAALGLGATLRVP